MRRFKAFSRIITALSLTVIMCLNFAAAVMADMEEGAAIEASDTPEQAESTVSEETSSEETASFALEAADEYGKIVTGWLKINNYWYYFESSGAMVTGNRTIGGRSYSFNSSGVCTNP